MLKYFIIGYIVSFVIGFYIFYPIFKHIKRKREEEAFIRFQLAQQEMQKVWNNVYPNGLGGYIYKPDVNKDENHIKDEES